MKDGGKDGKDSHGEETAPVVYHASRKKALGIVLGGLVFVALGIWLLGHPEQLAVLMGWLSIGFFGLCAVCGMLMLVPGSSCLILEPSGFTVRHLWRDSHFAWRQVRGFGVILISGNRMVAFDLSDDHPQAGTTAAHASRALCGYPASLADAYGLSPDELAAVMEEWREEHGGD